MGKFLLLLFIIFYVQHEQEKGTVDCASSKKSGAIREPRMSYVAKIIEEEKGRQIFRSTTATPLDAYDDDEDENESEGVSGGSEGEEDGDTEEVEENIMGLRKKPAKSPAKVKILRPGREGGRFVAQRSTKDNKNWYVYNKGQNMKGRVFGSDETGLSPPGTPPGTSPSGSAPGSGGAGTTGTKSGSGSPATSKGGTGTSGSGTSGAAGKTGTSGGSGVAGGSGGNGTKAAGGAAGSGGGGAGAGGGAAGGNGTGAGDKGGKYNVVRAKPSQKVDPSGYNFFQFQPKSKLGWLWLSKGKSLGPSKDDPTGRLNKVSKDDKGADIDDIDEANEFDWEFRRYDRACLYVENKKKKADVTVPTVPEEIKRLVDIQNQQLARRFMDWQFIQPETPESIALGDKKQDHPHYLTYKFLDGVISIFTRKICKNASNYVDAAAASAPFGLAQKALLTGASGGGEDTSNVASPDFLPTKFVENLFSLFLVLRNMTSSEDAVDYPSKEDDEIIFEKLLKKCNDSGESIPWFAHSCGDQLLSSDQYNNYACTPFVEYDFITKKYDPILDSIWHMFNAVHSYCFKEFLVQPRLWHRFSLIIGNAYTPEMRLRWKASVATEKFYMRLLGPESLGYFETINRCTFASTLRSDAPMLLPRFDSSSQTTFGMEQLN